MSAVPDILPSSVPHTARRTSFRGGVPFVRLYCMNCGCDGGETPESAVESGAFVGYLCEPCAERWSPLFGTMLIPDEVFWAQVKAEQIEREGRELQPHEVVEALKDGDHYLSKMAKDRARSHR